MFIIKLIYSILFIGCGAAIIKYRKIVHSWTGSFAWAERYLGRGSTYFIILLFGAGMIVFGLRYPFIETQNFDSSSETQNKVSYLNDSL